MRRIDVHTDGGCLGNPGPGGWAALIFEGPTPTEISGYEEGSTNQRMELRAAIEALGHLEEHRCVRLFSDSAYLTDGMRQGWYRNWEKNGWKTSAKKPVKNRDLWEELVEVSGNHDVEWVKVTAHAGNPANERCDALVRQEWSRRGTANPPVAEAHPPLENEGGGRGGGPTGDAGGFERSLNEGLADEISKKMFLHLLDRRSVTAASLGPEVGSSGPEAVVFDPAHRLFEAGNGPYFVRFVCLHSDTDWHSPNGFRPDDARRTESFAEYLGIPRDSLYLAVCSTRDGDIGTVRCFSIPFSSLHRFEAEGLYSLSVGACEEAMASGGGVFAV